MSNPRRGSHIHPPPAGDVDVGLDVGESDDTIGMLDGPDRVVFSDSERGTMRRKHGIDDEDDRDTDPDGWQMPDWD